MGPWNERVGHVTVEPFPWRTVAARAGGFLGTLRNPSLALVCMCPQLALFQMPDNYTITTSQWKLEVSELPLLRRSRKGKADFLS